MEPPGFWRMAELLFPDALQILDFFHVSEYLWEVARHAFPRDDDQQRLWVETQQDTLKQSQWCDVVNAAQRLPPRSDALATSIERLVSYLRHNQSRIDYQTYRQQGLMIGLWALSKVQTGRIITCAPQANLACSGRKLGAEAVNGIYAP